MRGIDRGPHGQHVQDASQGGRRSAVGFHAARSLSECGGLVCPVVGIDDDGAEGGDGEEIRQDLRVVEFGKEEGDAEARRLHFCHGPGSPSQKELAKHRTHR